MPVGEEGLNEWNRRRQKSGRMKRTGGNGSKRIRRRIHRETEKKIRSK